MESLVDLAIGFVTLLLLPLLGVLAMLRKRAIPWLVATLAIWILLGAWAVRSPLFADVPFERRVRTYWVGVALGTAFILIAWLRTRRRVARWVKLALGAFTLAAFARALWSFLHSYA